MPEAAGRTAIIVGSGYSRPGENSGKPVATRYGDTSSAIREADFPGQAVLVLARHGEGHTLPPHAINYRANIRALADRGTSRILALNTVGVITPIAAPGELAIPDQVIDYTWGRAHSFSEPGSVLHVDFTRPYSDGLRDALLATARAAGLACADRGVYAATQGPRLESAAEIDRLERDGADFVGMTGMPEAALARELGLEYACIAMVVNRAAGRGDRPIHDDLESSTLSARDGAKSLLEAFFRR